MKTWMISIFSITVMTFLLTGCGEEGSMSVNSLSSSEPTQQTTVPTASETGLDGNSNEYGISSELGTPPEIPSS